MTLEQTAVSYLQAIGEPTRFKIIMTFEVHKEITIPEAAEELKLSTSTLSRHFDILCSHGIMAKTKVGRSAYFTLESELPFEIYRLIWLEKGS